MPSALCQLNNTIYLNIHITNIPSKVKPIIIIFCVLIYKGVFISLYLNWPVSIIKGYFDNIVWSAKLCNRIMFTTLRVKLIREIRRMIMKSQFKP